MNLPNRITVLRVLMIPVFLVFLYSPFQWGYLLGCVVFIVASITDIVDGYIARKDNLITDFGKFLDPLADKLLVTAALISLVDFGTLPAWVAIIIVSREFIVTGMRLIAATKHIVIAASTWGKLKTISHMVMIIVLLFSPILSIDTNKIWVQILIYLSTLLTIISGVDYLVKNKELFDDR